MKTPARRKRGRGRPALPPEKKKKFFPFRLSDEERKEFEIAAKAERLLLRVWMLRAMKAAMLAQQEAKRQRAA